MKKSSFSLILISLFPLFSFIDSLLFLFFIASFISFAAVNETVEFCLSSKQSCHINFTLHHTTLLRGETVESRSWKVMNTSKTRFAWRKSRCSNDILTLYRSPRCACGRCSKAMNSSMRNSTKFATAEAFGILSPLYCR